MTSGKENSNNEPVRPSLKEQGYLPARYILTGVYFFGFLINFHMRNSMNLAVVAMSKIINDTETVEVEDQCSFDGDDDDVPDYNGEFDWNEWIQSLITGSFYWTYVIFQVPVGRLADRFGTKLIFGTGMALTGLLSLIIPVAAHWHYGVLISIRMLMGICLSSTYPSTQVLLARWAPPSERSVITTFIFTGVPAATIIGYPLTASLIDWIGWESVFYVQGVIALLWCILYVFVVSNSPAEFRWISEKERNYIIDSIGNSVDNNKNKSSVPWKQVFTSTAVWALIITAMGDNWGFFTLLTDLPLYMKNMMKMDINSNAVLSACPYIGMWVASIVICLIADWLIDRKILSTTVVRKIVNTITQAGPALCLFCIPLVQCNKVGTIALLFVAVTLNGGTGAGYEVNILDLSPNYAGTIFGLINTFGNIPAFLAPMTVGALTNGRQTNQQWQTVFFLAGGFYMADTIFYLIFGSGEEQPWNRPEEKQPDNDDNKSKV